MKFNLKITLATGFTYLLLSAPQNVDAQTGYRPPVRFFRPPIEYQGFPQVSYSSITENEGKRIIQNYLKRNDIHFRMDKPLRFRADGRIFEPIVDFQLVGHNRYDKPTVIEYKSLEDEQIAQYNEIKYQLHREFINRQIELIKMDWTLPEWQKQRIIANYLYQLNINSEPTTEEPRSETTPQIGYKIPRPLGLLNKEDTLKRYEKIGGKVFFIERQDTKEGLERGLLKIVEDATKNFILTEEQAVEIIANRLNQERIQYRTNTIFGIDDVKIRPNFLIYLKDEKMPIVIEYLGPNERQINRKIRDYDEYKQKGGMAYVINQATKGEFSKKLDDIVKALTVN